MAAPESQRHSGFVVSLADHVRNPALRLCPGHAHRDLGAAQRIHREIADLVDSGAGDPVLASHRAFPADLASHDPPQFLGQAGAVQCFAAVLPARGAASFLQLDRIHPHGHRNVLPHVPVGE